MAFITVSNTFTNGTTADATQVNTNFSDLIAGLSDGTKDISVNALTAAGTTTLNGPVVLGDAAADAVTLTGTMTSATAITITPTTNQLVLGTTRTVTISATQPASSSRVYTIPDCGAAANFLMSQATQTATGKITFAGGAPVLGVIDASSPSAGYLGEYSESNQTTPTNVTTSNQWSDLASLALQPGDYDVVGTALYDLNGATCSNVQLGVSVTSGNSSTGLNQGVNFFSAAPPTSNYSTQVTVPRYRMNISSTQTVYLKVKAVYSAGTPQVAGGINFRRIR